MRVNSSDLFTTIDEPVNRKAVEEVLITNY